MRAHAPVLTTCKLWANIHFGVRSVRPPLFRFARLADYARASFRRATVARPIGEYFIVKYSMRTRLTANCPGPVIALGPARVRQANGPIKRGLISKHARTRTDTSIADDRQSAAHKLSNCTRGTAFVRRSATSQQTRHTSVLIACNSHSHAENFHIHTHIHTVVVVVFNPFVALRSRSLGS